MKIKLGPRTSATRGTGIRAELTAQTETDLDHIRRQLARLSDDDPTRRALLAREAELARLLDDLEQRVLSVGVLAAATRIRA